MKNRIYGYVSLLLVVVMAGSGCSRGYSTAAQDPRKAFQLLNQVYTGSLDSMRGELDPSFQKGNPDRLTAGTSAALRGQFGAIRNIRLQSIAKAPMNSEVVIWTVAAERGGFEMQVAFNGDSKVIGLSFRSSSAQEWTPSHVLGADYLRPGTAAAYGPNLMKGRQ